MTDLLLTTLVVGAAVAFALEILASINFFDKTLINKWASLPLSFLGILALYRDMSLDFFVTVPASTFVALAMVKFINKPQQVEYRRIPRI